MAREEVENVIANTGVTKADKTGLPEQAVPAFSLAKLCEPLNEDPRLVDTFVAAMVAQHLDEPFVGLLQRNRKTMRDLAFGTTPLDIISNQQQFPIGDNWSEIYEADKNLVLIAQEIYSFIRFLVRSPEKALRELNNLITGVNSKQIVDEDPMNLSMKIHAAKSLGHNVVELT